MKLDSALAIAVVAVVATLLPSTISASDCANSTGTSRRKAWRDMTCDEQDAYLNAVTAMKNSGIHDEFVRIHLLNSGAAHGVPEFLPWHRWYIYQYEKAQQEYANVCSITLPY